MDRSSARQRAEVVLGLKGLWEACGAEPDGSSELPDDTHEPFEGLDEALYSAAF